MVKGRSCDFAKSIPTVRRGSCHRNEFRRLPRQPHQLTHLFWVVVLVDGTIVECVAKLT